jgi:hypothetical protein
MTAMAPANQEGGGKEAAVPRAVLSQVASVLENENLLLLILLNTSIRTASSASASCHAMRAAASAAAALWTTVSADLLRKATAATATTAERAVAPPPSGCSTSATAASTSEGPSSHISSDSLDQTNSSSSTLSGAQHLTLPDWSLKDADQHINTPVAITGTCGEAVHMGALRHDLFIDALGGVLRQHGRHVQCLHLARCTSKELPEGLLCDLLSRWVQSPCADTG